MLKFLAHCWLILSLLVAPLQFATADIAVIDHGSAKCEMMDMADHDMPGMDHDMSNGGCECPEQCKVSCASAHISLGMVNSFQFASMLSSQLVIAPIGSIHSIEHLTELRPPIV